MKKMKFSCTLCDGKCEVEFDEKEYIEPNYCPFCGKELVEGEIEEIENIDLI